MGFELHFGHSVSKSFAITTLGRALSVLALPYQMKVFELLVTEMKGYALLQKLGSEKVPVAYLSKVLDSVARGWPACLQSVAATAILIQETDKIILRASLNVYTPHSIQTLLEQKLPAWATSCQISKYTARS